MNTATLMSTTLSDGTPGIAVRYDDVLVIGDPVTAVARALIHLGFQVAYWNTGDLGEGSAPRLEIIGRHDEPHI